MTRCRKIRYRDELDAKIALASTAKLNKPNANRNEKSAYRCPGCKGWHLTSQGRA